MIIQKIVLGSGVHGDLGLLVHELAMVEIKKGNEVV